MLPPPDVQVRLPSGIEVVLVAMDAPRVVVEHRVRAGAAHEAAEALGVAHLVEHVVFSPVTTEPAGDYIRYVEASGGSYDATTHVDHTVYRATVRAADLTGLLEREARRLGPRTFTDAAVVHERGVIEEERAWRIDGSTGVLRLLEEFGALLPDHPYGRAVAPAAPRSRPRSRRRSTRSTASPRASWWRMPSWRSASRLGSRGGEAGQPAGGGPPPLRGGGAGDEDGGSRGVCGGGGQTFLFITWHG